MSTQRLVVPLRAITAIHSFNLNSSFPYLKFAKTFGFTSLLYLNYFFPGSFGLPEEPTLFAQIPPTEGNPLLSPAGAMYSVLLQLRTHVETEEIERTTVKRLVQRLQRDFALLQPQIELLEQPTRSKSS